MLADSEQRILVFYNASPNVWIKENHGGTGVSDRVSLDLFILYIDRNTLVLNLTPKNWKMKISLDLNLFTDD